MYLHMNSNGGVSVGGSIGSFFGFGDSYDFGSNHLFFPKDRTRFTTFANRAEYEENIRQMDIRDGAKVAIYGAASIGLAIAAKNLEEKGPKITTAASAGVCAVYALGAGYSIYQRHRRYADYLQTLETLKKVEETEKEEPREVDKKED